MLCEVQIVALSASTLTLLTVAWDVLNVLNEVAALKVATILFKHCKALAVLMPNSTVAKMPSEVFLSVTDKNSALDGQLDTIVLGANSFR